MIRHLNIVTENTATEQTYRHPGMTATTQNHYKVSMRDAMTTVRVGIYDSERQAPQRLIVDVDLWAELVPPFTGTSIEDCVNYVPLLELVTKEWPERPHTDLLETLLEELVSACFNDPRVSACRVALRKPDIFAGIAMPHVEFFRTRPPGQ